MAVSERKAVPEPTAASQNPSAPLYLAAFAILFCGIEAVSESLPDPDDRWRLTTTLLTAIGLLFSFGCRRLAVPPRLIEFGFSAAILLLAYGMVTDQVDWQRFLPVGGDKSELRLASCLAWASTFWSWTLLRDDRVLFCPLLSMAIIGCVATVNVDQSLLPFGCFVLATLFLLIHQNSLRARARASQREQARAGQVVWLGQAVLTAFCGLAALLLGSIVVVPAQAVMTQFSLGQAIRQMLRLGNAGGIGGFHLATPFSDEGSLPIGTGAGWSTSGEVLMHVSPSDRQEHYWRGRTYDLYTGEGWKSALSGLRALPQTGNATRVAFDVPPNLTPGDVPGALPITTAVTVRGETSEVYYAGQAGRLLLDQDSADPRMTAARSRPDGRLDLVGRLGGRFGYAVESLLAPDPLRLDTQNQLRRAGTDDPPEVRRSYLSLKDNDVTTAVDLAFFNSMRDQALQSLPPQDRGNRYAQTAAIRDWVSRRCTYSLDVAPIPANVDHVRDFLGNNRRGYCDLFASSMAVLCRSAGIPARVATGFAPGERAGDGFNLRVEDKHAWTEVYFPRMGWIDFDPTAGSITDGSVPLAKQNGAGGWRHFLLAQGPVPLALGTVILLIGLYLLKTEALDRFRRGRISEKTSPATGGEAVAQTPLGQAYQRMLRILGGLGLPRRPSETPAEFAARARPFLETLQSELGVPLDSDFVALVSARFAAARYGANVDVASSEELARGLSEFARAARRARVRLWGRALMARLKGRRERAAWN